MKKCLTYDDFLLKYHPVKNHLYEDAAYDGCMFETYGEQLEYVLSTHQHSPQNIWTLVEGENNDMWLSPGYHYIDRLGYMITKEPIDRNELDIEYCMEDYHTTGEARNYTTRFMESFLDRELTQEEIDAINDYYSEL